MPDWYPRYPAKFDHGTIGFTLAERGAYSGLLDQMYLAGEFKLPDDDKTLASLLRCSLEEWLLVSVRVRAKFQKTPGFLVHHVVQEKVTEQARRSQISRDNGMLGGRPKKRRLKDNTDQNPAGTQAGTQGGYPSATQPKPTDRQKDIDTNTPLTPQGGNGRYANWGKKNGSNGHHSVGILLRDPEKEWRGKLEGFKKYGLWLDSYGPKPREDGCEAPENLVREILG